ncbi:hypothetical protein GQ42DRAFT_161639 [Ramicandelaber brevisporus]|nr:hypothetical protein GQ42DRAFT_161639 [Ramicandelaber brevisporus]
MVSLRSVFGVAALVAAGSALEITVKRDGTFAGTLFYAKPGETVTFKPESNDFQWSVAQASSQSPGQQCQRTAGFFSGTKTGQDFAVPLAASQPGGAYFFFNPSTQCRVGANGIIVLTADGKAPPATPTTPGNGGGSSGAPSASGSQGNGSASNGGSSTTSPGSGDSANSSAPTQNPGQPQFPAASGTKGNGAVSVSGGMPVVAISFAAVAAAAAFF